MKKALIFSLLLSVVMGLCAFNLKTTKALKKLSAADSLQADRKHYMDEFRLAIKGKEKAPADSVFKNIKLFKGVPAGRVLAIMNFGYSNSLGVSCGHCHDTQHFEMDTKPEKEITRKMAAMSAKINNVLLKSIDGLKGPNPVVNCTTCHRGSVKPALDMSDPAK